MLPLLPTVGKRDRAATANPLSGKFTRQEFLGAMGQLVWFSKDRYATDLKVQRYRGEPSLLVAGQDRSGARRRRVRDLRQLLP